VNLCFININIQFLLRFETVLDNKQKQLLQITKQLDNLLLKYTSPENEGGQFITDQEYQTLKNRLAKEKASLESDLKTHGKVIEEWVELSERTFNFARYAQMWFAKGDMATRRAIFAALGSHLIIKDQKLNVKLHNYFKVIFENCPVVEKELSAVRTSENTLNKTQIAQVWAKCLTFRCILEIARTEFCPRPPAAGSGREGKKSARARIGN